MRRAPLLACLCAAVLALVACSSTKTAAATVNGDQISNQAIVNELQAINANPSYLQAIQANFEQANLSVKGTTPGSFDANFVAQVVVLDLKHQLVSQEVAKRKLKISDECRQRARTDLSSNLGNGDATTGESYFSSFDPAYRNKLLHQNEEYFALRASLANMPCSTSDDGKTFYDQNPAQFTGQCLSVIQTNDQASAASVVAQARAGADFAALARSTSTEPQTGAAGGDVGCHLLQTLSPDIASVIQPMNIGDVSDPVPVPSSDPSQPPSGQYFVIKLTGRNVAPYDEVSAQAEELAGQAADSAFGTWLQNAQATAKVTVDPRYGTWDPSRFTIVPPSGPATSSGAPAPASSGP